MPSRIEHIVICTSVNSGRRSTRKAKASPRRTRRTRSRSKASPRRTRSTQRIPFRDRSEPAAFSPIESIWNLGDRPTTADKYYFFVFFVSLVVKLFFVSLVFVLVKLSVSCCVCFAVLLSFGFFAFLVVKLSFVSFVSFAFFEVKLFFERLVLVGAKARRAVITALDDRLPGSSSPFALG